jgi:hypothetical protein
MVHDRTFPLLNWEKINPLCNHAWFCADSFNLEINLEKGKYMVYVCVFLPFRLLLCLITGRFVLPTKKTCLSQVSVCQTHI